MKKIIFPMIILTFLIIISSCGQSGFFGSLNKTIIIPEIVECSIKEDKEKNIDLNPNILIRFSVGMDKTSLESNLSLSRGGQTAVELKILWNSDKTSLTIMPKTELAENNPYVLKIKESATNIDGYGMKSDWSIRFITRTKDDTTPPEVIGTEPVNGKNDVNKGQNIIVYFSEEMNKSVVGDGTSDLDDAFGLYDKNNNIVNGYIKWVGANIVFQPFENLTELEQYTIKVTVNAEDIAGNRLNNEFISTFTVRKEYDTTPPIVTGTAPDNSADNVPGGQNIIVYFSEAMDKSTVGIETASDPTSIGTKGAFRLKDQNDIDVTGDIKWLGNNLVFQPYNKLKPWENYKITVDNTAKDLAGNALISWSGAGFKVFGRYVETIKLNSSKYFGECYRDIISYEENGEDYFCGSLLIYGK